MDHGFFPVQHQKTIAKVPKENRNTNLAIGAISNLRTSIPRPTTSHPRSASTKFVTMPAPTALLKQVDDTPPSNLPLPEPDQDEDFTLEGMNELPEDANAILQPVRRTGEDGMEIDEEDKPHFAPVQNTVCFVPVSAFAFNRHAIHLTAPPRTPQHTSKRAKSASRRTGSRLSRAPGPRSTRRSSNTSSCRCA